MRRIGRWLASHEDYDLVAPPQELVGHWPSDQKRLIVEYLHFDLESLDFLTRFGYEFLSKHVCEFGCGADWTRTSMHICDGAWMWPVHLVHYVQEHNVLLPEQFIQHVLNGPDEPKFHARGNHPEQDETYWLRWCLDNRSYSERRAIKKTRDAREASRRASINQQIRWLIEESGVSRTPCRYRGCNTMALSGKAFCARCIVEKH